MVAFIDFLLVDNVIVVNGNGFLRVKMTLFIS